MAKPPGTPQPARYFLSQQAQLDLDDVWVDVWVYVASYAGAARADRAVDRVTQRLTTLAAHPYSGRRRGDLVELGPGFRSAVAPSFVVYYRPASAGVYVHRILHGRRDQDAALFG